MNAEYTKKISSLSNIAWKQYKAWAETKIELRDELFWDRVTKDIRELVKKNTDDDTRQFFTDLLNAFAGLLNKEASKQYEQGRLNL